MPRRPSRKRRRKATKDTKLRLKAAGKLFEEHPRLIVPQARPVRALASGEPRQFSNSPMLSIVTATYGRRAYLQQMVRSARASLHPDTPYEIVVVDGGSRDGTQEWCQKQSDVVLLQGDLTGAVPNFNKGFVAAGGRYVVTANDDIEFMGDSLQLALDYMKGHPRCGAGCFPHSRPAGETPWVSLMAVSVGGVTRQWPMVQVGIVPKWLGDRLGWWGQTTGQYYGDQFLSRRIWEEGFTCSVIPDVWITDHRLIDDLRRRNDKLNRGRDDAAAYKRVYPSAPKALARPQLKIPFEAKDPNRASVDVVLGTYNRLEHLQRCIESHRKASERLKCRFIVVDGGSTDGTKAWLKEQPDVLLVEDSLLDGAVRAFNRGFARATADYVVNANDDMTIEGSLKAARDYLENHPGVGQLAFPKANMGEDYKTHDCLGKLFANFGMTRRWLGNYVGWWGWYTYKYFGDVHVSLAIWELGYRVEVYDGCKCRDYLVEDDLRGAGGGNVQCDRDSLDFERLWPSKEGRMRRTYVHVPGSKVVLKAEFE